MDLVPRSRRLAWFTSGGAAKWYSTHRRAMAMAHLTGFWGWR